MMISLWVCYRLGGFITDLGDTLTEITVVTDHKIFTHFNKCAKSRIQMENGDESRIYEDLSTLEY